MACVRICRIEYFRILYDRQVTTLAIPRTQIHKHVVPCFTYECKDMQLLDAQKALQHDR